VDEQDYNIHIAVQTAFIPEQSDADSGRFAFAYTISIRNDGNIPAKLMTRHWVITHGNGKVEEVNGDGVVGEQPHLRPGESFEYTSGTILETPFGDMNGTYHMLADDGVEFEASIPQFALSLPNTLH
jgi:ApaG protein